jgi:hypothetical protein
VRVLALSLSYILPIYALIYVGRVSRADVRSVDDLRLFADVSVFVAIALAAVLGAAIALPRPGWTMRAAVAGVVAVAVGLAVSWTGFAVKWHRSTSSAYVSALRADLATNRAPIVPTPVPDTIVPAWVQPDFSSASLVRLLKPGAELSVLDSSPRLVSGTGHLVPARLNPVAAARNARSDFCGNGLVPGTSSVTIPFREPVPYYRGSLLELRLLVTDSTRVGVSVTGSDGSTRRIEPLSDTEMLRGPHRMVVPLPPNVRASQVTVTRSRETAGVCVTGLSVVVAAEAGR